MLAVFLNYNQLFGVGILVRALGSRNISVYLYEGDIYVYDDRKASPCKKGYFRECIGNYLRYMKENKVPIRHITDIDRLPKNTYHYFDLLDRSVERSLNDLGYPLVVHDSPSFLLSREQRKAYGGSPYTFNHFYGWARKELGIFPGISSHDKENRSGLGRKEVEEVSSIRFPTDHGGSLRWLNAFVKKKLSSFGPYQDAVSDKNIILWHSGISPMMNMGLITPSAVIAKIPPSAAWGTRRSSYEGFLRQIFWREYMALIYAADIRVGNIFKSNRKLPESWYSDGYASGIPLIDAKVKQAITYGYLHHIERLMLVGNYILLNNYSPREAYNWFMANFVDAHHWVMEGNVYHMLMWSTGRVMSQRPYIASSTYLRRMVSGLSSDDLKLWDTFYKKFILRNLHILVHTYMISGHIKRARSL